MPDFDLPIDLCLSTFLRLHRALHRPRRRGRGRAARRAQLSPPCTPCAAASAGETRRPGRAGAGAAGARRRTATPTSARCQRHRACRGARALHCTHTCTRPCAGALRPRRGQPCRRPQLARHRHQLPAIRQVETEMVTAASAESRCA